MVACHFYFQFQVLTLLKGSKELGVAHFIVDKFVTEFFLVVNFHHFSNIKRAININKKSFKYFFTFLYFLNDIILQWVLGHVTKI